MNAMQTESLLNDIVDWVKNNISSAEIEHDFNKNFLKTTKPVLAQYLLSVAEDYGQQITALSEKNQVIESLNESLAKHKKEVKKSKQQILSQSETIEKLNQELKAGVKTAADVNDKLSKQQKKNDEIKQSLESMKKQYQKLEKNLLEKTALLEKMSLKSMESVITALPEWMEDGVNWKDEFDVVQKEKNKLLDKVEKLHKKLARLSKKDKREVGISPENSELASELDRLSEENKQLLAKVAQNADRVGEQLGDYEKRENYQVAKDYEEFCLYQGIDYLTEEIVNRLSESQGGYNDQQQRLKQMEIKALLIQHIIIEPYQIQIRKLRTQKKRLEFQTFKKKQLKSLFKNLELTEQLEKDALTIARKGFDLIIELLSMRPPCQLLIPEQGLQFSAVEHDVDPVYCKPEGNIKFTLVPGIYVSHEVLMKPVVVTDVDND